MPIHTITCTICDTKEDMFFDIDHVPEMNRKFILEKVCYKCGHQFWIRKDISLPANMNKTWKSQCREEKEES